MEKILKYPLAIKDKQEIWMPEGSKILSVQEQYKELFVWVLADMDKPVRGHTFAIHGTGHPLPEIHDYYKYYVATVLMNGGALVWHVFNLTTQIP